MPENINVITIALTITALLIALIAPIPILEEQRVFIITAVFLVFLTIMLTNFNKRLESQEEKFNIHNQLIEIKADIKSLQMKK